MAVIILKSCWYSPIDSIIEIINHEFTGVINVAAADGISKYDFGLKLAELFGLDRGLITPISVDNSNLKVPRPKNMTLNTEYAREALGLSLPTVYQSLERYYLLSQTDLPMRLKAMLA